MIKKIFSLLFIGVLISSCGNTGSKEVSSNAATTGDAVQVEFSSLVDNPSAYVGKKISVEGKVVHVCTHSGKKLFITGDNPDVMLYVQAGEEMPKFPMELLGSEVVVEGTLTRVAAKTMPEGEGTKNAGMSEAPGTDTCETAKALSSQVALADLMMVYDKHSVIK
ncbi:MAG TPA: hypothetical protein PLX08_03865 [Bacteroidales bacterium]|jgi:hypothetical protein|nr:hypothetical protein [Bacteroidales bacterium]